MTFVSPENSRLLVSEANSRSFSQLSMLHSQLFLIELSTMFFLGSYDPRSGTGATQSYWRHEVVLAAEGDWRIFTTHYPLLTTHYGS